MRGDGHEENRTGGDANCKSSCLLYTSAFAVTMLLERMGCGWFGIDELWEVVPSYPTVAIGELDVEHVPQFNCRWTYLLSKNPEMGQRWYQGGDNKMVGHGITGLIPRKTYMETHPEWFALVDGVRDPQSQSWWQYDYTNEELEMCIRDRYCTR